MSITLALSFFVLALFVVVVLNYIFILGPLSGRNDDYPSPEETKAYAIGALAQGIKDVETMDDATDEQKDSLKEALYEQLASVTAPEPTPPPDKPGSFFGDERI